VLPYKLLRVQEHGKIDDVNYLLHEKPCAHVYQSAFLNDDEFFDEVLTSFFFSSNFRE